MDPLERTDLDSLDDLGWLNDPLKAAEIRVRSNACRNLGHQYTEIHQGPANRGMQHIVMCRICGFFYSYDSSD